MDESGGREGFVVEAEDVQQKQKNGFVVEAEDVQQKQKDGYSREQDLLEEANATIDDWLNYNQV